MEFPKTYRTNLGWAMAAGAAIALIAGKETIAHGAIIALVVVGGIGGTWAAWEHKWLRGRFKCGAVLLLMWGGMGAIGWWVWPRTKVEPPSLETQEQIRDIDQFIGQPEEGMLREEFGFPEMMNTNIRAIINNLKRYTRTGVNHHYDFPPGGTTLIDWRFAKGHIQRKGGSFGMDVDDLTVYFIVLPREYVSNKARLAKMTNSTALPSAIIESLKHFDSVIQKNATHLIEVLSAAMDQDHNLYLQYDNPQSPMFHKIDALYLDTFIQLRPEADKVRDATRNYLHVN
jgi:hypothetical protein